MYTMNEIYLLKKSKMIFNWIKIIGNFGHSLAFFAPAFTHFNYLKNQQISRKNLLYMEAYRILKTNYEGGTPPV